MRVRLIVGLTIGSMILVLLLLPLLFLTLSDPAPVRPADLSAAKAGVYTKIDGRTYQLCPYSAFVPRFPSRTTVVQTRPLFYVKYRQLDRLSAYGILVYPNRKRVEVDRQITAGRILEIRPKKALPPGSYCLYAARDGMGGGTDFHYFVTSAP